MELYTSTWHSLTDTVQKREDLAELTRKWRDCLEPRFRGGWGWVSLQCNDIAHILDALEAAQKEIESLNKHYDELATDTDPFLSD